MKNRLPRIRIVVETVRLVVVVSYQTNNRQSQTRGTLLDL